MMSKKQIGLIVLALMTFGHIHAQGAPGDTIILSSSVPAGEITACKVILLKPGFFFKGIFGQSLILKIDFTRCYPDSIRPTKPPGGTTPTDPSTGGEPTDPGETNPTDPGGTTPGGTNPGEPPTVTPSQLQNYIKTVTHLDDGATGNPRTATTIRYFDGLGRPNQLVQVGITPNKNDLVTIQEYDAFGREWKTGLPISVANKGAYYTGGIEANSIYGDDSHAYSETQYEASPLNRVVKQFGPGEAWRLGNGDGHAVGIEYLSNSSAHPCALYSVNGNSLVRNENYDNNTLYVTKTTDEDGKVAYEFKDKLGQVVLQRQMDDGTPYDTYYVYDDFGNKRFVLSPLAADGTTGGTPYTDADEVIKNYAYLYRYDERNRCIWQKLPGADYIEYRYDKADHLIFSQDGELRAQSKWKFSMPDIFGRVVLEGVCVAPSVTEVVKAEYTGEENNTSGYAVSGINWSSIQVLQVYYYDNYKFKSSVQPFKNKTDYDDITPDGFDNNRYGTDVDAIAAKGLLTGSITCLADNPDSILGSVFYYDSKGRVIQSIAQNHLSGYEKEYVNYSFTGQPTWKKHTHSAAGNRLINETYRYAYDHANRPTTTYYKLDNAAEILLSDLAYDELGRVSSKELGGNTESITYKYNLRSWLKNINSTNFKETLHYEDSYSGNTPLYNGNISASYNGSNGYQYTYDGLNRLKMAIFTQNKYNEEFGYDKHGNITMLRRHSAGTLIDDLTLTYTGNQLKKVTEGAPRYTLDGFVKLDNAIVEYTFNKNGAMTKDLNGGISTIEYNLLNLPKKIKFTEGHTTDNKYDAMGIKRQTTHTRLFTIAETTDYCGNIIYEKGALKYILNTEGYVTKNGGNYVYNYYLRDHLGNNRVVMNGSTIVQKINYYPSGMPYLDNLHPEKQPYKFGGKEFDEMFGLNRYDQIARQFGALIPTTTTIDPYAEMYYSISPYAQYANNPVNYVDPDGRDVIVWYQDDKEKWRSWTFNGTNQSEAPQNQYVQDFITAYNYNIKNGGGENMSTLANSREMSVQLKYGDNYFDKKQNAIFWDPKYASETKEGHVYSPATILEHEGDHTLDYKKNPEAHNKRVGTLDKQYENKEERRVITGSEAKTARANGEFPAGYVRSDHFDHGDIRVSDPTKTTRMPSPTLVPKAAPAPSMWQRVMRWWNN
ncbi:cell well associated RhsD protein [Bacteroidia bacterium]|nr:cell well associated RhsD protein [Bacteroidia bacterium]